MLVFKTSWHAQTNNSLFTLCLNSVSLLCTGMTHYKVHPLFTCDRLVLLSSRRPIFVPKADSLPMDCSGHACSPASSNVFVRENLEPQDFRRMWAHFSFSVLALKSSDISLWLDPTVVQQYISSIVRTLYKSEDDSYFKLFQCRKACCQLWHIFCLSMPYV
jgi:hypothetical protein